MRFNPAGFAPPPDTNLVFTKHEQFRCYIGFPLDLYKRRTVLLPCAAIGRDWSKKAEGALPALADILV